MTKRLITLLLAAVLIFSLFPAHVLATEKDAGYQTGDTLEVEGTSAPTVKIPDHTEWQQQGDAVQKRSKEPSCGKTLHSHDDAATCNLQCTLTEHVHAINCSADCALHVHTPDCCKAVHVHGNGCSCTTEAHSHIDSCYGNCPVHTCTEACQIPEGGICPEIHTHGESCALTCGKEVHAHSDACCTARHQHSEACLPGCGQDGHTHITDGCGGDGVCTAAEHTHGDGNNCTLACALEEHAHTDDCYAMVPYTTWKLVEKPAALTNAGSTEVYLFAKNGMQSFMTNMHQRTSGSEMVFCFGTPSNHTELSFADLTASGGVTLQDKGNKSIQVNATGIGEVCYTTGGVTYAFPVHNIMDDQAGDGNAFTVMQGSKAVSVGIGGIMDNNMVFFGGFGDLYQQDTDRDFSKKLFLVAVEDIDSNTKSAASQDFFDLISDMRLSVISCEDNSGNPVASPICTLSSAARETAAGRSLWAASVNAEKGNCFIAKIAMSFTLQGKRYTTHCDVFYYPDPNVTADATSSTADPEQITIGSTSFQLDGQLDTAEELNYVLSSEERLMDWLKEHKQIDYTPGTDGRPSGTITLELPAVTYDQVIVSQPIPENKSAYIDVALKGTGSGTSRTTMPGLIIKGFTNVSNISFVAQDALTMTYENKTFTCGILADYGNAAAPFGPADFTDYDQNAKEAYLYPMPMNCSFDGFDYGIRSTSNGHVAQMRHCQFTDCGNAVYVDCKDQNKTLPTGIITGCTFSSNQVAVCLRNLPAELKPYDVQIHDNSFIGNTKDFRITTPGNPHYYYFYKNYFGNAPVARAAHDPRAAIIDLQGEESAASAAVVVTNPCRRTPDDDTNLWIYNQDGQFTKIKTDKTGTMLIDSEALDAAGTTRIALIQDYATATNAAIWTFQNTEGGTDE